MNRARVFAAVLFAIGALLPTAAPAQNLEAGKSPGQLFSNTCSACHRSPRGLLRTVPPGSLPGFLREHYTTSKDMAQQLAGFLISNGASDPRARPQEARQQPAGVEPQRQPRPGEPEQARPQRPIEQERAAQPPEPQQATRPDPREEARLARRERRARREAEQKRLQEAAKPSTPEPGDDRRQKNRRMTPARIEAATARGKDALPLGSVVPSTPAAEIPKPDVEVAPVTPTPSAIPSEPPSRADPVPQVTPAPTAVPATAEAPRETEPEPARASDDPPSGSTAPPPSEAPVPAPPAASGPPPAPPISN